MKRQAFITGVVVGAAGMGLVVLLWTVVGPNRAERAKAEAARAQVRKWVEKLDGQTTPTGAYVRWQGDQLPENDPWGGALRVAYSQGGLAENVTVRSAGSDGALFTNDDIVETRASANLKGVGTAVKEGIEEVSEKGARGAGRGAVRGIVEGVKGSLQKKDAKKE